MQTTAYIALGANLGDRAANLRDALARLDAVPRVRVIRISSFLENPAIGGPADSPPFLNAAAELQTSLDAHALLEQLLTIERSMGRERRERWGPRLIDLDLLLFDNQIITTAELKVPHPLLHERDFVLAPLGEIAPDVRHPVLDRTIGQLHEERRARDTGVSPVPNAHAIHPCALSCLNDFSSATTSHGRDARVTNMSPSLRLRSASNADGPGIRDLVFSVLHEYGLKPDPCSTDADLFDVEGTYPRAGGRFDVLVDDAGTIRGTVGLLRVSGDTCELRKMYLHRNARGQGWGRRLLDHALAEARRLGFKRMTLETATPLKEAIGLYTRYGFRSFTPQHMVPRCDQAYELWL